MSAKSLNMADELTVEQYLTLQCEQLIKDFQKHNSDLIFKLKEDYREGALSIRDMMTSSSSADAKKLCVILKCIGGAHIGQRFILEPNSADGEDVFKMGRSTGKLFKEKGVSLYKDKEISTTHAKIEIRNGQVFLVDARSTNGTLLNSVEVEAQIPLRLREGDIIIMGTTELMVHVTNLEDLENFPPEDLVQQN